MFEFCQIPAILDYFHNTIHSIKLCRLTFWMINCAAIDQWNRRRCQPLPRPYLAFLKNLGKCFSLIIEFQTLSLLELVKVFQQVHFYKRIKNLICCSVFTVPLHHIFLVIELFTSLMTYWGSFWFLSLRAILFSVLLKREPLCITESQSDAGIVCIRWLCECNILRYPRRSLLHGMQSRLHRSYRIAIIRFSISIWKRGWTITEYWLFYSIYSEEIMSETRF